MERGILACLVLASPSLPLPDQIIFDVFEYGGSYKHLNSPMRFLPPSSQVTEVIDFYLFFSSDRSSYSDSMLLKVQQPLFEILSIYANIYRFSF